ncbi:MAG: winged helix-turn-helix transcriptional regulator [Thermoproteota archaeon]
MKGRRETVLSVLDYQIIYAIRHNSRKPISEVAEELAVSSKTVRHHLSRLIDRNLIDLSIEWYPDTSNDIISILHLYLKPSFKREDVGPYLINKYAPQVLFYVYFSNLPNEMICIVWSSSMNDLKEVLDSFKGESFFESIEPNILYSGYIFETWRDQLVVEKGAPLSKRISGKTF